MLKYNVMPVPTGAVSVKAAAFGPQGYIVYHGDALALEGARRVYVIASPNDFTDYQIEAFAARVTPEAGEPVRECAESLAVAAGEPATGGGASSQITPLEPRLAGIADEEPPLRACANGGCGDE